jgi:membrane carboxypeptidase/penicillin-binding protein
MKEYLVKKQLIKWYQYLRGAVERGTAKKLKSLKVPLAGKTGTTNDNYDAWFIGFSSNLVLVFILDSTILKL